MPATLEYGLHKDGRMRHITDVKNGGECDCVCPNPHCGQRLIAKNNPSNIIALNFAHASGAECPGAKESELHRRAKQIVCDQRHIMLPDKALYKYESAKHETAIGKYRADVSLTGKNYPLLVEIVVTCELANEKTHFLRQSGKKTLVIDLKSHPRNISQEQLKKIVIEDWEFKSIIEPVPMKLNPTSENSWSLEKIIGAILIVALAIFWAIPAFFKCLRDLIIGKRKRKD